MRQLTAMEKAAIAAGGYTADTLPTQAVTIEWEFAYRSGGGGVPITEKIFYWEEMAFPAALDGTDLKIHELYIDNPVFFSSTDSPTPEVTGTTKPFMNIVKDTLFWNPEVAAVGESSGTTRANAQLFKTSITPAQIWARRVKVYTFNLDGAVTDIDYYVINEVGLFELGGIPYSVGDGVIIDFTKAGEYYYFSLLTSTMGGAVPTWPSGGSPASSGTPVAAESVIPDGDSGKVHLLNSAAEAAEYIKRVTLTGGAIENDVYADRQKARENLAEALWG